MVEAGAESYWSVTAAPLLVVLEGVVLPCGGMAGSGAVRVFVCVHGG